MRKAVFTLNIGDYAPEIRRLTYPLMKFYAHRIQADFIEITERKYPEWSVVYEKLQIHELGKGYDWIYFFDADTLIHPETIDFTWFLPPDVCLHNGQDHAAIRFRYDEEFAKGSAANIGTCGWFTCAPAACIDIWTPTDQTPAEVKDACFPTMVELRTGLIDKGHLADDYVMSRNIARLGIRHATVQAMLPAIGLAGSEFFWHIYNVSEKEKVRRMKRALRRWNIPKRLFDGK